MRGSSGSRPAGTTAGRSLSTRRRRRPRPLRHPFAAVDEVAVPASPRNWCRAPEDTLDQEGEGRRALRGVKRCSSDRPGPNASWASRARPLPPVLRTLTHGSPAGSPQRPPVGRTVTGEGVRLRADGTAPPRTDAPASAAVSAVRCADGPSARPRHVAPEPVGAATGRAGADTNNRSPASHNDRLCTSKVNRWTPRHCDHSSGRPSSDGCGTRPMNWA